MNHGQLRSLLGLVSAALIGATALAACTPSDPALTVVDESATIRVGAGEDRRLEVIAALMAQALRYEGYRAEVIPVADLQTALDTAVVDVIPQCTGTLLAQFDRPRAEQLLVGLGRNGEPFSDKELPLSRDDLSAATLVSAAESLPSRWEVGDPGAAEACGTNSDPQRRISDVADLPQFVVPIYREGVINRGSWKALNIVAGTLTPAELEGLLTATAAEGMQAPVLTDYLPRAGFNNPKDKPE